MINIALLFLLIFSRSEGDVIVKLQDTFSKLNYIQAEFSQISEYNNQLEGKFFFAKEKKYRIELPHNVIISDGKSIWNHDKDRERVVISNMDEDPLAFSLDEYIFDYPSKCNVTEEKVDKGYLLFLDASSSDLNFKTAKLWINEEFLIEKILVVDFSGSLFTLQFTNIQTPKFLDDSLFIFNKGNVKVIDLR